MSEKYWRSPEGRARIAKFKAEKALSAELSPLTSIPQYFNYSILEHQIMMHQSVVYHPIAETPEVLQARERAEAPWTELELELIDYLENNYGINRLPATN